MGVVLAGCMSPVMHFGAGKSSKEAQHDTLNEFVPAQLSIEGPWRGPIKDAKVRVFADHDYRAQNLSWQKTFGEELVYANASLATTARSPQAKDTEVVIEKDKTCRPQS